MKAKLIKVQDEYWLSTDKQTDFCYHLGHKEILKVTGVGEKSGEVHHEKGWNKPNEVVFIDRELSAKLSLKNCQAIENGYDLHELAVAWAETVYEEIADNVNILDSEEIFIADTPAFKAGFQKAVEILGDKKFTEENMEDAYYFGSKKLREEYLDFIKTFQQNEWEVEILDERDSEGRLILKRV